MNSIQAVMARKMRRTPDELDEMLEWFRIDKEEAQEAMHDYGKAIAKAEGGSSTDHANDFACGFFTALEYIRHRDDSTISD